MMFPVRNYTGRFAMAVVLLLSVACGKDNTTPSDLDADDSITYVNVFAANTMRAYYLWADEISDRMDAWKLKEPDPVSMVASLRYRDAGGRLMDRWTELLPDFDAFYGSVSGQRRSYGLNVKYYYADEEKTRVKAVVTYTYADSPAREAGLQRGDEIWAVNGKQITPDNYLQIAAEDLQGGERVELTMADGSRKSLEAVQLYENPIQKTAVLLRGGERIGYLHYTAFTLDSCAGLIEVFKSFKDAGVRTVILDMRYNGGGYAFVEGLLASMLAPEADVAAGHILSTSVFNKRLANVLGEEKVSLTTEHVLEQDGKEVLYSTLGANPGISQLYAIVDSGSASATEALLCELYPYLPITLVGGRTHGKYCGGLMFRASKWYEDNAKDLGEWSVGKDKVPGWGIYVMYSRFADRDGVTRCMPNGLAPDYPARDDPMDGYALGDPREAMLAATLSVMAGASPAAVPASVAFSAVAPAPVELPQDLPAYRILLPH